VDHMKTRLEFISKDSESGSYKGVTGAAPGRWQTAAKELGEGDESEDEEEGPYGGLLDIMRGLGHMQANDSGWPTFDGGMLVIRVSRRSGKPTGRPTTLQ
jgi:hypothetical protein